MAETVKHTPGQWPDNIVSGDIRYAKADNYDGFYLADASHGIPTFASVTETATPTIRSQHVRVFNYPAQTEALAAELVRRWNAHTDLLNALKALQKQALQSELNSSSHEWGMEALALTEAAIAKAEGRS